MAQPALIAWAEGEAWLVRAPNGMLWKVDRRAEDGYYALWSGTEREQRVWWLPAAGASTHYFKEDAGAQLSRILGREITFPPIGATGP